MCFSPILRPGGEDTDYEEQQTYHASLVLLNNSGRSTKARYRKG